ncbi:hypothetical protein BU17DRAFT_68525 [Hysterangium stoloniferum]|nr:hypothetical protein BU17DRAFT_68525 [Hysterangium stoloniferum]
MIMRVLESVYKFPALDQPPAVDIHEYRRGIPTYGLFCVQRRPKSEDVALIAEGFLEEYEKTISELELIVTLGSLTQSGHNAWWTSKQRIEYWPRWSRHSDQIIGN